MSIKTTALVGDVRTEQSPRLFSFVLLVSFFFVFSTASATDHPSCRNVYNNIINAIGRLDPPAPVIVFRTSASLTAEIKPNGEIHIGDKFIETCRLMGKDSLNAMALVIGHELAHHYQNHFWAKEYGSAYADAEWGKKMGSTFKDVKEMGVFESQADEFGMFYGYVAGYSTLGLSASLYEKIYQQYQLPENLSGYPSLNERKKIAELSEERVKRLIPVFESGKLLSILSTVEEGEYRTYLLGKSAECFEHIIDEKFTSREIFNNLGVTHLLLAIGMVDKDENPFTYPVMLDDESRLYDALESDAGTKGSLGFSGEQEFKSHLDNAEKYFNHAKELDKNYLPAYINLACVGDLRKEYEDAAYMAGKALKLSNEKGNSKMAAYSMEIQAIILAHTDAKKEAEKKFAEAKAGGSLLSENNLAALTGAQPKSTKQPVKLSMAQKEETVDNKSLYEILNETEYYPENLYKLRGESRVIKVEKENADLYVIECTDAECPYNNIVFHQTQPTYNKSTSREIRISDSLQKMTDAYGKEDRIMPSGGSDYYVFKSSNIIFKISNKKVEGWAIYFHI